MLKIFFNACSLFAVFFSFGSPLRGSDAPVWEEQFGRYQQGAITRQSKSWYLDQGEAEAVAADYTISAAPDGTPALSILRTQKGSRLGYSLKGKVADEQSGNLLTITFFGSATADAALAIRIFAEQGRVLVANVSFLPNGEVILMEGKTNPTRKLLPFLWVPGEWNKLAVSVFPESEKVRIRLLNAQGEAQGEVIGPLIREQVESTLPWWTIHFSQGALSDTPWFVSSISLAND